MDLLCKAKNTYFIYTPVYIRILVNAALVAFIYMVHGKLFVHRKR